VTTRRWSDLAPGERRAIVLGGAVQLVLLGAALADLRRRPSDEIRGGKRLWVPAVFVNFVGPVAYFLLGRKR
jgi:hypothetical protein